MNKVCVKCNENMVECNLITNVGGITVAKGMTKSSGLNAFVCTKCGYTEFYAKKPEKFK